MSIWKCKGIFAFLKSLYNYRYYLWSYAEPPFIISLNGWAIYAAEIVTV